MLQDCEKQLATGYGVEVLPGHHGLEVVPGQGLPSDLSSSHVQKRKVPRRPEPKILGMRKTTFVLSSLLLIMVIAAAIACGVGGSLAARCIREFVASDFSSDIDCLLTSN